MDCGGPCAACGEGRGCIVGPDCESRVCSAGTCLPPGCEDKVMNGAETDRDCGGTCAAACAVGEGCITGEDCETGVCGATLMCVSNYIWSSAFSSTKATLSSVAPDAMGNVVLAGAFDGSINVGGDDLATSGQQAAFIAKFAGDGQHVWSRQFGDAGTHIVKAVAVDTAGHIYVVGDFASAIDLGEGPLPSTGERDIFVAKLDADGSLIWGNHFGDAADQSAAGIAVGADEGVVITGMFEGVLDFGGNPLASAGNDDAFVVKLGPSGEHVWSARFGNSNSDQGGASVAVDMAGDVVVTGGFLGMIDIGGAIDSKGKSDAFTAKLDGSNGDVIWGKAIGSASGAEAGRYVGALSSGELLVVGGFDDSLSVVGEPLETAGGVDIFVLKLTPSGDPVWIKSFGSSLSEIPFGAAVRPNGNIVLGGVYSTLIDFGGGPLLSLGNEDIFLAQIDQDGNHIWSRRYGGKAELGLFSSVAFGAPGIAFAAGWFKGAIDLGGGPLMSTGDGAIFLAKYLLP